MQQKQKSDDFTLLKAHLLYSPGQVTAASSLSIDRQLSGY